MWIVVMSSSLQPTIVTADQCGRPCPLGDGPTWMCAAEDPLRPAPFGTVPRRQAVEQLGRRAMREERKQRA